MDGSPDSEVIRRELDTGVENPGVEIAETVADIESVDATDLTAMYECVDGVLDNLFSTPPAPEAQMEVAFSYHTYRITVTQDGAVEFVKTG
jgi:hypothetical protein